MNTNKTLLIVIALLSFQFISCATMQMDYENAKKIDTIEAYEELINKYPNSSYQIEGSLKELKDKKAFKDAEHINTRTAYQKFVQSYPDNVYVEEAQKRISESDKDAYVRTLLIGTERALSAYIDGYPESIYLSDARERITWIADKNKHLAKVEIDVRYMGFRESSVTKKKILKLLKNGLAGSGIYMESTNVGTNDNVMNVSIEYIGKPSSEQTVGELVPLATGGGAIPALVGVLIDEILEEKLSRPRRIIPNGYKMKISYGNNSSFDTGYYYIDAYDPSYFIKLHDVIIWLKESEGLHVNTLYAVMGNSDDRLRDETAKALSFTRNISDRHFISALTNNDWMIRESAINLLSYREDESLLDLIKPLIKDNNYRVRIAVLKGLSKYNYKNSSELFINALSDEHEIVREVAVVVQRIMKDKEAVTHLIKCLRDPSKDVRTEAAWALKKIGDKRAVEPLIQTLDDRELLVRIRVESALESITGQRFGKDVKKWQEWWTENKTSM